jgi:hypothetical protein
MRQAEAEGIEPQRRNYVFMLGLLQKNTLSNRVLAEWTGLEPYLKSTTYPAYFKNTNIRTNLNKNVTFYTEL